MTASNVGTPLAAIESIIFTASVPLAAASHLYPVTRSTWMARSFLATGLETRHRYRYKDRDEPNEAAV